MSQSKAECDWINSSYELKNSTQTVFSATCYTPTTVEEVNAYEFNSFMTIPKDLNCPLDVISWLSNSHCLSKTKIVAFFGENPHLLEELVKSIASKDTSYPVSLLLFVKHSCVLFADDANGAQLRLFLDVFSGIMLKSSPNPFYKQFKGVNSHILAKMSYYLASLLEHESSFSISTASTMTSSFVSFVRSISTEAAPVDDSEKTVVVVASESVPIGKNANTSIIYPAANGTSKPPAMTITILTDIMKSFIIGVIKQHEELAAVQSVAPKSCLLSMYDSYEPQSPSGSSGSSGEGLANSTASFRRRQGYLSCRIGEDGEAEPFRQYWGILEQDALYLCDIVDCNCVSKCAVEDPGARGPGSGTMHFMLSMCIPLSTWSCGYVVEGGNECEDSFELWSNSSVSIPVISYEHLRLPSIDSGCPIHLSRHTEDSTGVPEQSGSGIDISQVKYTSCVVFIAEPSEDTSSEENVMVWMDDIDAVLTTHANTLLRRQYPGSVLALDATATLPHSTLIPRTTPIATSKRVIGFNSKQNNLDPGPASVQSTTQTSFNTAASIALL